MNKGLLTGLILLLVVVGGYLVYSNTRSKPSQQSQEVVEKEGGEVVEKVTIEIKDFKYSPATLRVKPGEKITVTSRDTEGHSVTSDKEGLFNSGILGKDKSGSITAPSVPGTYPFHCTPHPSIVGTLIVEG